MKITKKQIIKMIQEEFAIVKAQEMPQNRLNSHENSPYFDYPDEEGAMAKRQLQQILEYSNELLGMLNDNEQLEAWVQSKITKAADYISTVKHYLAYEMGDSALHADNPEQNPFDMDPHKAHIYEEDKD